MYKRQPRNLTGVLSGGWSWQLKTLPQKFVANVYTNVKYARALQFGFTPRNLAPRPYLVESMHMAVPIMRGMLNVTNMVQRAVSRLGKIP